VRNCHLLRLLNALGRLVGLVLCFGSVRTVLAVVTEFASLAEAHGARGAEKRLFARVRVFMFLLVLRQTEALVAKATLDLLFGVVFFVVALQGELRFEGGAAPEQIALEDRHFFVLATFLSLLLEHQSTVLHRQLWLDCDAVWLVHTRGIGRLLLLKRVVIADDCVVCSHSC